MKILLVQLSFLGDTILSTPVVAGLKQVYPESEISVLTTPLASGLLKNDPLIKEVLTYDKRGRDKGLKGVIKKAWQIRKENFDKVYSLHRSYRTSFMLFLSKIKERVGFKDANLSFLYTDSRKKKFEGHAAIRNLSLLFKDINESSLEKELRLFAPKKKDLCLEAEDKHAIFQGLEKKYITMAPGSAWKTKQWFWQGFLDVAMHYEKENYVIVLIGGPDDVEICSRISRQVKVIDLSGRISLEQTLYVMQHSSLVICNDSMSLHMASAFKVPTIAVFCATSPRFGFGPWQNPDAIVVEDETLECKPCRRHGSNQCPNQSEACMTVASDIIIEAGKKLLKKKTHSP